MFVNWVWEFQKLVCDNHVWKSSCILRNETNRSPLHDLYVDISYKFTLAWLYVLYVSHACTQITTYTCLVSGTWYISYIIFHDLFHNSHEQFILLLHVIPISMIMFAPYHYKPDDDHIVSHDAFFQKHHTIIAVVADSIVK